jgi:cyanophycinase
MSNVRVRILFSTVSAGLLLVALALPAHNKSGQRERIPPEGIDGSVLLCGEGKIPEGVVKRFVELAGGDKAHLILIPAAADPDAVQSMAEEFKALKPASLAVLPEAEASREAMRKATGVWIAGGAKPNRGKLSPRLGPDLRELLQRKGVVAAAGRSAAVTAQRHLTAGAGATLMAGGWGFLPSVVLDLSPRTEDAEKHFRAALKREPGWFGLGIGERSAVLVQGRTMRVLGEGRVLTFLAESAPRAEKVLTWRAGAVADFTALRRAAVERSGPPFPPKEMGVPAVPRGALFINGGGGIPEGGAARFIELAGGKDALIVVLPTAIPDPVPDEGKFLRKAGATNLRLLKGRTLAEVESPEYLALLKKAGGVWFGGGRQWRFVDAYAGTKAESLLHDVLRRGGVIGGSSAGASIQGEYMPRGDPRGNLNIIAEGYERGLNFLPGVGIDQHFSQRKRHRDMTGLVATYPQLLGIGLDEKTAIVVRGHVAEVMGTGKAHFYDRRRPVADGAADYEALTGGGRYDLKNRKVMPAGSE